MLVVDGNSGKLMVFLLVRMQTQQSILLVDDDMKCALRTGSAIDRSLAVELGADNEFKFVRRTLDLRLC